MKHLLAITIVLLPTAALAQQFTPQQMLDVMTKSPSNRGVRVQDGVRRITVHDYAVLHWRDDTSIQWQDSSLKEDPANYSVHDSAREISS